MGLVGGIQTQLAPAPKKMLTQSSYLNFNEGAGATFAQQYLPELYEAEIERYGNRTLSGFLKMVGAEESMKSDQVIWSEQGRLHIAYEAVIADGTNITVTVESGKECVLKVGNTIVINAATGGTVKARVEAVDAASGTTANVEVSTYQVADLTGLSGALKIFVYGSEFGKGSNVILPSIEPDFTTFSNKPIIMRESFEISGSDTAQIGWVEVAAENGQSGYLWYLKSEAETRLRFEDYIEMAMIEAEKKGASGSVALEGTEGLFAAIEDRGHVMEDYGAGGAGSLGDFDEILKQLDKEGGIEENMIFADRGLNLSFDDMLAELNAPYNGGASYGVFDNDNDMALNLGFSGFRRGSYDFYKTDWKYLNDATTRGNIGDINGVLVPAGTSTVYDQSLGSNIRRPFLHVRYRASEADDRKMKTWVTGSVGAQTSALDAMQLHFLTERCLCVQAANNFVLFKS